MQAQIESLTQELGTDLADTLSPAEQREKARLTKEIETLKRQLAEFTDKRVEVWRKGARAVCVQGCRAAANTNRATQRPLETRTRRRRRSATRCRAS